MNGNKSRWHDPYCRLDVELWFFEGSCRHMPKPLYDFFQRAEFAAQWDRQYPSISALWRRNWQGVIPFFQFPPEIRKIVYTTNAIESLNMSLLPASGPTPLAEPPLA